MFTIYISGIVVAFILLLIMAIYEKYVKTAILLLHGRLIFVKAFNKRKMPIFAQNRLS